MPHKDINLTKTYLQISPELRLLPCLFCINFKTFSLKQHVDLLSTRPWHDCCNLRKTSRVQSKLHEQHENHGAASGWPATGARDCWKIVTDVQLEVGSCQQKRRFTSCKHLLLVSLENEFQFFDSLRSEFWHHWNRTAHLFSIFAVLTDSVWYFYSVTCIHPLQSSITTDMALTHWYFSLNNSFWWFHTLIIHLLPSRARMRYCIVSSDNIEGKNQLIFESVTDSKYICTPGVLSCSFIHIKPFMPHIKPNTKMLVKKINFIHDWSAGK